MATLTLDLPSRAHSTDAPSMADTLPSVNFNFEDLRQRMARFTERFDDFIEQGRRRVLEERNTFRMNIAELKGSLILHTSPFHVPVSILLAQARNEGQVKRQGVLRGK